MTELLITGGLVVDATGERRADVRIAGGVVTEVGAGLAPSDGERSIVADGMVVSPGFVDLHTHLREPGKEA